MALCVIYIGVSGSLKGQNTLTAIISIAIGAIIGELLDLDRRMRTLGDWVQETTPPDFHTREGAPSVADGFVTASLCSARRDGRCRLTGKRAYRELRHPESQSVIDGIAAIVFASSLAFGVSVFCRSHLLYQGSDLSGGAGLAVPPAQ